MIRPRTLTALRLAAQCLSPGARAPDPAAAARAVCGIQAQDLRAATLAFRSRVEGVTIDQIEGAPLVRMWTARGTLHLVAAEDRDWMHAALVARRRPAVERSLEQRGQADVAAAMFDDLLELIAEQPLARPDLMGALAERGHPELNQPTLNVLMPWVASKGLATGDAEGRWLAASEPSPVDEDEALATLARRYLEGYGPAADRDLAAWAGIGIGTARRAIDLAGPLERSGQLLAVEGTLDGNPPPPAQAALLSGFDTLMLGYDSREPVVAAEHDRRISPGGGMLRPAVLARGRAVGTWRLGGAGAKRRVECDWFGRRPARAAVAAEAGDVGRLLATDVTLETG